DVVDVLALLERDARVGVAEAVRAVVGGEPRSREHPLHPAAHFIRLKVAAPLVEEQGHGHLSPAAPELLLLPPGEVGLEQGHPRRGEGRVHGYELVLAGGLQEDVEHGKYEADGWATLSPFRAELRELSGQEPFDPGAGDISHGGFAELGEQMNPELDFVNPVRGRLCLV